MSTSTTAGKVTNPFDLNTKSSGDLLNSAKLGISAPTTTGYNATTAGATGYNAA